MKADRTGLPSLRYGCRRKGPDRSRCRRRTQPHRSRARSAPRDAAGRVMRLSDVQRNAQQLLALRASEMRWAWVQDRTTPISGRDPSGPEGVSSGLARAFFTCSRWSEQPCVRPVSAVHVTAGHNALRGSGPGQKHAFDNALAHVGCPDRRIDRLCITCCSPFPTVTSRRMPDAISVTPPVRRVPYSARPWSSSPKSFWRFCLRARWRQPWSVAAPTMLRAKVDVWCHGSWHSG